MAASDSESSDMPHSAADPQRKTSLTLLQRLRANDNDAWRVTVQLYTPLVYHWCARGGVRGADAEDVAQEVFRAAAEYRMLIYGIALLLLIRFRPQGLMGTV